MAHATQSLDERALAPINTEGRGRGGRGGLRATRSPTPCEIVLARPKTESCAAVCAEERPKRRLAYLCAIAQQRRQTPTASEAAERRAHRPLLATRPQSAK